MRLGEHLRVVEADADVVDVGRGLVEAEVAVGPAQQVEHRVDRLVGGGLAQQLGLDGTGLEQGAGDAHPAGDGTRDRLAQRGVVDGARADDPAHQRGARAVGAGAGDPAVAEPDHTVDLATADAGRRSSRPPDFPVEASSANTSGSPNASSEPSRFTVRASSLLRCRVLGVDQDQVRSGGGVSHGARERLGAARRGRRARCRAPAAARPR